MLQDVRAGREHCRGCAGRDLKCAHEIFEVSSRKHRFNRLLQRTLLSQIFGDQIRPPTQQDSTDDGRLDPE